MQAVQVGKFWSMAGGHAFVVLFISSAVTALYAHMTCHTMSRPDDYLIRAEAKYISVLLSAFFLLGGPSCICPCHPYLCLQCRAPSLLVLTAMKSASQLLLLWVQARNRCTPLS